MITDIQKECIRTALKKMIKEDKRISICTIDEILKITGGVPSAEDYNALRLLHCVKIEEMSPTLRMMLPRLIEKVLSAPGLDFEIKFKSPAALLEINRP